jgi:hypothetical protein
VILKKDAVERAIHVVVCEDFLIFLDPDNRCFTLPKKIGEYLLIGNASHSWLFEPHRYRYENFRSPFDATIGTPTAYRRTVGWLVNDGLEKMRKEAVVAWPKVQGEQKVTAPCQKQNVG